MSAIFVSASSSSTNTQHPAFSSGGALTLGRTPVESGWFPPTQPESPVMHKSQGTFFSTAGLLYLHDNTVQVFCSKIWIYLQQSVMNVFSHLERWLQQCSVHCSHNLQLLPWVWRDFTIKTRARAAVPGLAFSFIAAVADLRDVVVVADCACVAFVIESGSIVEQKEAATSLYVLFHRIHHSCREEMNDGDTGVRWTWVMSLHFFAQIGYVNAHSHTSNGVQPVIPDLWLCPFISLCLIGLIIYLEPSIEAKLVKIEGSCWPSFTRLCSLFTKWKIQSCSDLDSSLHTLSILSPSLWQIN